MRWGAYFNDYEYSLKSNLIEFTLHIPLVYFNLFFLVPRYVLTFKYYKYALSLESSDKVPNVIIKLSKLMEYVLYDVKGTKFVPLIKEIDSVQNYIEIEKLRFENVEVTTTIESNIDEVKVPPLLFISLITNAFKHGGFL